jgi:tRNA G10  N-methylase Trm11
MNRRPDLEQVAPLNTASLAERAAAFHERMPFRNQPYSKKTWGHKRHSLCSYQGKLKPAMAHWLVREFVPAGGRVLDPLGGVGTIAFEAASLGFDACSNDLSPLAYTVASGKLSDFEPQRVLDLWGKTFAEASKLSNKRLALDEADFGLNGSVRDFYHPDTLREVMAVRAHLRNEDHSDAEVNFIRANLLHILHGNRPYALSRKSHPITPFHPTGPTEYKSVDAKMRERLESVMAHPLPSTFKRGTAVHGDFRTLNPKALGTFDCIVTSPPFYGMRFDRPNWLRLWFCGWTANDFHQTSTAFLERQQVKSLDCYGDFFKKCHQMLKPGGTLILHVGSGGKRRLDIELADSAADLFSLRYHLSESVSDIESHGLADRGLTDIHHLLFLERNDAVSTAAETA